jgi:mono/diheme cytochrome c family protein
MSRRRAALAAVLLLAAAAIVTACGQEGIKLSAKRGDSSTVKRGAQLFAQRCSGCHTLSAAGTQGSAVGIKYRERTDGPNFDQRKEQVQQVLYAIRNGGFSGAIMPQNIVLGHDAQDVAEFVAAYSGSKAKRPPSPSVPQPSGGPVQESNQAGSASSAQSRGGSGGP